MEKVRDLLNRKFGNVKKKEASILPYDVFIASRENLPIHEDKQKGIYVKDLLEVYVGSSEEVYEVMRRGGNNRVVAYTSKFGVRIIHPYHLLTSCLYLFRHECRKFKKSFHFRHHHHAKECRHRCCKEWQTLLGRFGGFRKGKKKKKTFRLHECLLTRKIGWQDRCIRSNTRGSQKDQQVADSLGYGH